MRKKDATITAWLRKRISHLDYGLKWCGGVHLRQTTSGFDIQTVEIKGRCPVVIWGRRRGEVANYKAGTLAKIPRQAERFEELKNTTRLSVRDLIALVPRRILRGNEKPTSRFTAKPKPVTAKVQAPRVLKPKDQVVGSCSDRVISEAELQKLKGHYLEVAETLLGTHPIKTGRVVATAEDLTIFLMLLKWFTRNMNVDGSLPWARFKGLWDSLYEAGDISRAFDAKRFAAVRNYLSSLGLIEWNENKYHTGFWANGTKVAGKACKWKAGDVLMKMLEEEEREERDKTAKVVRSVRKALQPLADGSELDLARPAAAPHASTTRAEATRDEARPVGIRPEATTRVAVTSGEARRPGPPLASTKRAGATLGGRQLAGTPPVTMIKAEAIQVEARRTETRPATMTRAAATWGEAQAAAA